MLSFTIGASSITIFLDGAINSIDTSHPNHPFLLDELRKAPDDRDLDAIRSYTTVKKMIERFTNGRVTIRDMEVTFDGSPIANYLAQRMLAILDDGVDIAPYAAFMENVHANPASYVHDELFQWLEKGEMPITPDGHFLGFKKIRDDYTDSHSGKFDNSVGNILEMDRRMCDTNRHRTCSTGFHFCSPGYLKSFYGQRVVVVKINPRDVTSIPSDYQFTKGRTCRYEVIAELSDESAAHHGVWNQSVVDLENPAEFPESVISAVIERAVTVVETGGCAPPVIMDVALPVDQMNALIADGAEPIVFTTTDNRSFSADVVKAALDDASIRGAARNLGIQDSTLRGWKKKLGL